LRWGFTNPEEAQEAVNSEIFLENLLEETKGIMLRHTPWAIPRETTKILRQKADRFPKYDGGSL
jgi:hypothetical protein